jgi:Flp pilus assembly protein TadD
MRNFLASLATVLVLAGCSGRNPQNLYSRAQAASAQEDWLTALDLARRATEIDENYAQAWQLVAEVAGRIEDTEQARTAWQRLSELQPHNETALNWLAHDSLYQGHYEQAEQYCNQLVQAAPDATQRQKYRLYADALRETIAAQKQSETLKTQWQKHRTVESGLALAEAALVQARCHSLFKNSTFSRGFLMSSRQMRTQAAAIMATATDSLSAASRDAYLARLSNCSGEEALIMRDTISASIHFSRAADLQPGDARAQILAAQFMAATGDPEGHAERYFERALQLKPDELRYRVAYAEYLIAVRGEVERGRGLLASVVDQSEDPTLHDHVTSVLDLANQIETACQTDALSDRSE